MLRLLFAQSTRKRMGEQEAKLAAASCRIRQREHLATHELITIERCSHYVRGILRFRKRFFGPNDLADAAQIDLNTARVGKRHDILDRGSDLNFCIGGEQYTARADIAS